MQKKIAKFVQRYGKNLLSLCLAMSVFTSAGCHFVWYEPKEPDGLREFKKGKN